MFFHSLNGSSRRVFRSGILLLPVALGLCGLLLKSPLLAGMGLLWVIFEFRIQLARPATTEVRGGLQWVPHLLTKLSLSNPESEKWLREKIALSAKLAQNPGEERWLQRLEEMSQLRSLVFDGDFSGKRFIDKAFAGTQVRETTLLDPNFLIHPTSADIMLSATKVARLYTHLLDTCEAQSEALRKMAQTLFRNIFGKPYTQQVARELILPLLDQMQRDSGIPYLILSWVSQKNWESARSLARDLLTREIEMEEEMRSTLYWLAELGWFGENSESCVGNFESTIRYLYHLCLTDPQKVGFLEIDSRFYSQFDNVNELAREGLLFKDQLVEKVLGLWAVFPQNFDDFFNELLETVVGVKSKAMLDSQSWLAFWMREQEEFGQALLLTIEGNLSFINKDYSEAVHFYDKALLLDNQLRAAKLNRIFALAFAKDNVLHKIAIDEILKDKKLYPMNYLVAGDSHLLLNQEKIAESYYQKLRQDPKQESRVDFHQSVLLFDAGEYERALPFARLAHKQNPLDTTIRYHLSVCYDRVGEKDHALDHLIALENERRVEWLQFYRFTLERDSGRTEQALETLRKIPRDYFQDPEELEAALNFAKDTKDLSLMRQLRRYQ